MRLIEEIGEWIVAFDGVRSDRATQNIKNSFEDVIACMFAGLGTQETIAVRRSIQGWGSGNSRVVGCDATAPAPFAALANGTAAHALDFDDTLMLGACHSSAVLVPALLALGPELNCNGRRLVDAYAVGLQVQYIVAKGCMRSHGDIGWHSTSTLGAIAGAAACAYLMGLGLEETTAALSLSTSMMSGMKVQFGTGAKPLHAGLAAQHAVQAVMLARAGLRGSLDALDGKMGFLALCGGERAPGWEGIDVAALSETLAVESEGLMIKRLPCCAATHRALDCALDMQQESGIELADIEKIETHVGHGHAVNLMYPDPSDYIEARFSMQYCMAAALHGKGLGLDDFTPSAVARSEVRDFMPKVFMHAYAPEQSSQPHRVVIYCKDGRVLEGLREHASGTIHRPLSVSQRRDKFDRCCSQLPGASRQALWDVLQRLDTLSSCKELDALL